MYPWSPLRRSGTRRHIFGAQHTIDRFETAFYSPLLSDWSNFENWRDNGSTDATERANQIYKNTLDEFEAPALTLDKQEEIEAFIARRTSEGGTNIDR